MRVRARPFSSISERSSPDGALMRICQDSPPAPLVANVLCAGGSAGVRHPISVVFHKAQGGKQGGGMVRQMLQ